MKYKLEMYGWSVEAMGHSLNDSQVKSIQDLMESNGYSELWEVRNDLEEVGVKIGLMRFYNNGSAKTWRYRLIQQLGLQLENQMKQINGII
jgi:hypothetical protein